MVARFLVTTAVEETWPTDERPVLLLGEWCRLYEKKEAWERRDILVTPYHWDDRRKLHDDYLYLKALYEDLLVELTRNLNHLHGVNHSVRYWRIVTGPWLGYFLQMLFDRWEGLHYAMAASDISGVRVVKRLSGYLVPNDMSEFITLFLADEWNEVICGQLLKGMSIPITEVDAIEEGQTAGRCEIAPSWPRKAKNAVVQAANNISGLLCRENEFLFVNSYLPARQDFLLQLKLGQIPKLWRSEPALRAEFDMAWRSWGRSSGQCMNSFPAVARAMLPKHIPKAYLEGYKSILAAADRLPWPRRPKAIFTSNSYSADDTFKIWAAQKVESGAPLVIGQHGGNYGTALWSFTEDHQVAICDRFLTWGWSQEDQTKIVPIGNLKNFGLRSSWNRKGYALLVEMTVPRTSYWMFSVPVAGQWRSYFEEQVRFVNALPAKLRRKVLVRLSASDFGWSQQRRWKDRIPEIHLDAGNTSMRDLAKKTRLYISSYNATTYLESMSLNIPTIMFWNPEHWELRDSAIPYFEILEAAGIFHRTPEGAARQMSAIWDDVSGWWNDHAIQSARKQFCDRYAHTPSRPLAKMHCLLKEVAALNAG